MNNPDLLNGTFRAGSWGNKGFELFTINFVNLEANPSTHDAITLPEGLRWVDAYMYVVTASNASVTLSVGFKSVVGTNQDNVTALFSAQAINATAFVRKTTTTPPFTLAQKMYLRGTIGGAALSQAAQVVIGLDFTYQGPA